MIVRECVIYFILERCLLLVHKRLTIQTTNAIKDENEGHISPDVMGDPCTKTRKCDPSESNGNYLYNSMIGI